MWEVRIACVIMHNVIVEDKRDDSLFEQGWKFQGDMVEPARGKQHLRSSSMSIMRFVKLTIDFRQI
jgi:hypothetical protein